MQIDILYVENPYFGSYESDPCVYLHFKSYDIGTFYHLQTQASMDYVKKWKPLPTPPQDEANLHQENSDEKSSQDVKGE